MNDDPGPFQIKGKRLLIIKFEDICPMPAVLPVWVISWLIAGSVIYTLDAVVYMTKIFTFVPGVFGFYEMWHIFVMFAAAPILSRCSE